MYTAKNRVCWLRDTLKVMKCTMDHVKRNIDYLIAKITQQPVKTDKIVDGRVGGWVVDGWMDGWTGGWVGGRWMDGWMDGRMDG